MHLRGGTVRFKCLAQEHNAMSLIRDIDLIGYATSGLIVIVMSSEIRLFFFQFFPQINIFSTCIC